MRQYNINNPLVCFGGLLEDWVIKNPDPIKIKERKSRRYILANSPMSSLFGTTMNDMIGLDIGALGKKNRLKRSFIEAINEKDYHVIHKREVTRFKQVIFTHQQMISVHEITKQPVYGSRKEVVAISSHARDITSHVDLHFLFWHYQDLYCNSLKKPQGDAIQAFLKHLKLDCFFMKMPTRQELSVLLAMQKSSKTKNIATELGVSTKTIDTHKANLRQKLKTDDVYPLLEKLRTYYTSVTFE